MYRDPLLLNGGFPGEGIHSGRVVVIKTHDYGSKCEPQYDKAILFIRNLPETILANFNRQSASGNHTGMADPRLFNYSSN